MPVISSRWRVTALVCVQPTWRPVATQMPRPARRMSEAGGGFHGLKIPRRRRRAYCADRLAVMRAAHSVAARESRSAPLIFSDCRDGQPEPGGGTAGGVAVDPDAADARAGAGSGRGA